MVTAAQFIIYAVLLFFCINLLRAVDVTKLNRGGWIIVALTSVLCLLLAIYPVFELVNSDSPIHMNDIFALLIRILDALLVIVLAPVLWLYIQYQKSRQKQSLTFTVIILGIVCATIFDYIFQLITTLFPAMLSEGSVLYASVPEALFIFGYLIIAVGLYAHRKQDEWGFQAIDRIMSGEFALTGEE
jgi:hypothetical protein